MGKTVKIKVERIEDIFKANLVNCNILSKSLYKYMKLSRVLEMLKDKTITFVSPELWNDPYETKYLKTDYSAIGYIRPEQIYCFCARADNASEEASWNIYSNAQDDPLIKLSIKTLTFLDYIKNYAAKHNCHVYYSKVNYDLKTADIAELYKTDNKYHLEYFDEFDEEKYIKVMSLKRQAFKYENEIRLFVVPEDGNRIGDDCLLRIPIDYNMFSRYTFAPLERIKGDDVSTMLKEKFYRAKYFIAKEEVKTFDKRTPFFRSNLYGETASVDEITK